MVQWPNICLDVIADQHVFEAVQVGLFVSFPEIQMKASGWS